MSRLAMIAGGLIALLGIALIPLPGPGLLFVTLGSALFVVGVSTRDRQR